MGESLFRNSNLGFDVDPTATYRMLNGFRIGARLTLNTKRFAGHEFGYAYSRTKLGLSNSSTEASTPTHQGFYDFLLYLTPEGVPVRPFVAGGGQFTTFVPPGASVTYGTATTKYGLNYGAGFKVKVGPMFLIRVDLRDYATPKPFDLTARTGWLHQIEASAGFGIYF